MCYSACYLVKQSLTICGAKTFSSELLKYLGKTAEMGLVIHSTSTVTHTEICIVVVRVFLRNTDI